MSSFTRGGAPLLSSWGRGRGRGRGATMLNAAFNTPSSGTLHETVWTDWFFALFQDYAYYVDSSDAASTDNDANWTNDANAFDGDTATAATVNLNGTDVTNELRGFGTNAPGVGNSIVSVKVRVLASGSEFGALVTDIYDSTGAEFLGSTSNAGVATGGFYSSWVYLTTPTGGWTWAKVQGLQAICYKTDEAGGELYNIEVSVHQRQYTAPAMGAIDWEYVHVLPVRFVDEVVAY